MADGRKQKAAGKVDGRSQTPGQLTPPLPAFMTTRPDGVTLALKVQPRASKNEIAGERGGELVVRVTAPPVDSAANEAVIRLIAEALGCPRSAVSLIRGETSRHKVLHVTGVSPQQASRLYE
jgi:uncharacterized protein (TIGR00251 family)